MKFKSKFKVSHDYLREYSPEQMKDVSEMQRNLWFIFPSLPLLMSYPHKVLIFEKDTQDKLRLKELFFQLTPENVIEYNTGYASDSDRLVLTDRTWSKEKYLVRYPGLKQEDCSEMFQDVRKPTESEWQMYELNLGKDMSWCKPENIYNELLSMVD